MRKKLITLTILLLTFMQAETKDVEYKFDGILGNASKNIQNKNDLARSFLPYNPIIVEIGAYKGEGTKSLASSYPYGLVFSFEPSPKAYEKLVNLTQEHKNIHPIQSAVGSENHQVKLFLYQDQDKEELQGSLLPALNNHNYKNERIISVPCVVLDDWCKSNKINHIDFLRLDAEGMELKILKASPEVLNKVIVIVTRTSLFPFRKNVALFPRLKRFLIKHGFEMLAHWYCKDQQGEAVFVRKEYYDSIFR